MTRKQMLLESIEKHTEERCIEFAEWLREECWESDFGFTDRWRMSVGDSDNGPICYEYKTTAELYEQFKQTGGKQ